MDRRPRSLAREFLKRGWPWVLQVVALLIAAGVALDFPDDLDGEFPGVARPFFSDFPPATYRLAEPGDTLDRVAMYLSALGLALSLLGCVRSRREECREGRSLWIAAMVISFFSGWDAATPSPTFDGWHGIGPEALWHPETPMATRWVVSLVVLSLALALVWGGWRGRSGYLRAAGMQRLRRIGPLAALAVGLALAGRGYLGRLEPEGYWSRWAIIGSLLAFDSIVVRCLPEASPGRRRWAYDLLGLAAVTAVLIAVGLKSFWLHRPIDRLREVVPGKIFISAMPTPEGLPVAHGRHKFRTIINLFQEDLPGLRSPLLDDELAFAKREGIRYIGSPLGAATSDAFLDETLRVAQDPSAWPILVHCHACMDRTPAWWGIYQFVVEGKPLDQIMRVIERHRGSRPKASVTLLYNRVLEPRAPDRYRADPTAGLLRRAAEGVVDPYYEQLAREERERKSLGRRPASGSNAGPR